MCICPNRVDAIQVAEEERQTKAANRTNPLEGELIKTKGLLKAPSFRKERKDKKDNANKESPSPSPSPTPMKKDGDRSFEGSEKSGNDSFTGEISKNDADKNDDIVSGNLTGENVNQRNSDNSIKDNSESKIFRKDSESCNLFRKDSENLPKSGIDDASKRKDSHSTQKELSLSSRDNSRSSISSIDSSPRGSACSEQSLNASPRSDNLEDDECINTDKIERYKELERIRAEYKSKARYS